MKKHPPCRECEEMRAKLEAVERKADAWRRGHDRLIGLLREAERRLYESQQTMKAWASRIDELEEVTDP